jgi:hypothetical protein
MRFKEVDVERGPKAAQALIKKTGRAGVPVIQVAVGGLGFDRPRTERELVRLS